MKIIHISATTYVNSDDETFTDIFGLGDDSCVYKWSYTKGSWIKYQE